MSHFSMLFDVLLNTGMASEVGQAQPASIVVSAVAPRAPFRISGWQHRGIDTGIFPRDLQQGGTAAANPNPN